MTIVLRQWLTVVTLLTCGITLLPPAGFTLCVDTDGHLVVEARDSQQTMCCLPGADGQADESCQPDDCGTCVDYALSAGDVLRSNGASGAAPERTLAAATPGDEPCGRGPVRIRPVRGTAPATAGAAAPTPLRL